MNDRDEKNLLRRMLPNYRELQKMENSPELLILH
jgi:hypothetical protein